MESTPLKYGIIWEHPDGEITMLEQFIAEATECDFKVAVETKKPKSWLKSVSAFRMGLVEHCFLVFPMTGQLLVF